MIYEIYEKNTSTANGFHEIFQHLTNELGNIFRGIWGGSINEGIEALCFAHDDSISMEELENIIFSGDTYGDGLNITFDNEKILIRDDLALNLLFMAFSLCYIRRRYLLGDTDAAWSSIILESHLINKIRSVVTINKPENSFTESNSNAAKEFLSAAGASGADSKHRLTRELREWALKQAATMRGTHTGIARTLEQQVPQHLAEASKDPKRFIYDTLRQQNNPKI